MFQRCWAPSEIPFTRNDAEWKPLGAIAESMVEEYFVAKHGLRAALYFDYNSRLGSINCMAPNVYCGPENTYLHFLVHHNSSFSDVKAKSRLAGAAVPTHRPDVLVHSKREKSFYEVKPESGTGLRAGDTKVGTLMATYRYFGLPYQPGSNFQTVRRRLATHPLLTIDLVARLNQRGLITYRICVKSNGLLEAAVLATILAYVLRTLVQTGVRHIDLAPLFTRSASLASLATRLGVRTSFAARASWKYFWQAVVKKFAIRGPAMATLAAIDGPLPVGDLLAAGLAIWTIIDIVRLSDELWRDAAILEAT